MESILITTLIDIAKPLLTFGGLILIIWAGVWIYSFYLSRNNHSELITRLDKLPTNSQTIIRFAQGVVGEEQTPSTSIEVHCPDKEFAYSVAQTLLAEHTVILNQPEKTEVRQDVV